VSDYAGLLSPAERARLEARLAEGERATGAQVVIAIFSSLEGESLEDFSIRLAERWRIGRRGLDDGVIVLVFVRERRLRLEVGYGLEAVIPDAVAGRIVREVIAPRFREGRWAAGLEAAAWALYERIAAAGRAGPPGRPRSGPPPGPGAGAGLSLVGLLVVLLLVALATWSGAAGVRRARRRRWAYVAGPTGWTVPVGPAWGAGWGWPGGAGGGDGGFAGAGGAFGGGGASGEW